MSINILPTSQLSQVTVGDTKYGYQVSDHGGWYLEDGRAVSTLNPIAQANAIALGFSLNLHNATNTVAMMTGGTLGSVVGSNNRKIKRANLPNVNISAPTDKYIHNHGIGDGTNAANTVASGNVGMARRSVAGQSVTATGADAGRSGNEPDITSLPRVLPNDTHSHTASFNLNGNVSQIDIDITPMHGVKNSFVYLGG